MAHRAARSSLLLTSSLLLAACGGAAATPAPAAPVAQIPAAEGGPPPPASDDQLPPPPVKPEPTPRAGYDKEHPAPRCGPQDSYQFVAEQACEDGSRPLGGDMRAGMKARAGNVGLDAKGHVIDLYVLECPEGPVEIYVDMYGCPEYEKMLVR